MYASIPSTMKIRVLGAYGAEGLAQSPSAFLINDSLLIDGGTVGAALSSVAQLRRDHARWAHSHRGHVAGLADLTETLALCEVGKPLTIASLEPVVKALRTSIFNDTVWPDFTKLPTVDAPVLQFRELAEDVEQPLGGRMVTPGAGSHSET